MTRPKLPATFCLNARNRAGLLIVPLLLLLVQALLMTQMFPIATNSNGIFGQDPAYQYLYAGVDVLQGYSPGHTDHPGTPLQTAIAIIVSITWLVLWLTGLTHLGAVDSVLTSPELYLASLGLFFLFANCWAAYFLGTRVLRSTNNIILAASCQTAPLLFAATAPQIIYPTPETGLFFISITLMGLLAPLVFTPKEISWPSKQKLATGVGLLCGLGFAIKFTFAPMLLLPLMLRDGRTILRAYVIMMVAWVIGVLPIIHKMPKLLEWLKKIATHSGTHGEGAQVIFNWADLKIHILWLISTFSFFYYALLITISVGGVLLAWHHFKNKLKKHRASQAPSFRANREVSFNATNLYAPAIFLLIGAIHTLMVAKHVGAPYMVPVLPITTMLIAWAVHYLSLGYELKPIGNKVLSSLALIVFGIGGLTASVQAYQTLKANHIRGVKSFLTIQQEINKISNPILMGTFNCNFPECAVWFGILLSPTLETRMDKITPNFYHFNIFNKRLHVPGVGETESETATTIINDFIAKQQPVLLISPEYPQLNHFKLELIVKTPVQNLYRVSGIN
jgi:hypothetical protein